MAEPCAQSQRVTFPSTNKKGDGQAVLFPGSHDPAPTKGLIVVHEWWGKNKQIEKEAAEIAQDSGFLVLVPDMYRGKTAIDREGAGHLMSELDWPGAVADIEAAAKFLKSRGCIKVGVTGFCMGGALSFASAALVPDISAAAPFYGTPKPELADLTKITIPVQAHFASKDQVVGFSHPDTYNPLRKKLLDAGVQLEFYEYKAAHGFTNPESAGYDAEACSVALKRMIKFMEDNLE